MPDNPIIRIVKENIDRIEAPEVAISFSGGIDSTLLAVLARQSKKVTLYTINFEERGEDIHYARKAAQELGLPLVEVKITREELEKNFPKALELAKGDVVKAHVLAPLIKLVKEVKEKDLLFGAGTEELFMGYDRHYSFPKEELKQRLKEEFEALERNEIRALRELCESEGKRAHFPYYDKRLLEYVHSFPEEVIAKDKERKKHLLRESAKGIVPEFVRTRKKKALQYGTKVVEVFRKARRAQR
ncbi:MAG: asparagine synthase [Candidatus Micrarchaeota archaeon]|nr:asparagine synthase [Candidatus Micrarchaeota archaeon]